MDERKQILSYLRKWLVEHCASSPPATGGMPSPRHVAHWAKMDLLKEVIEGIEQRKDEQ